MNAIAPPAMASLRPTGIEVVGGAPWGTHFCQFYEAREDLISTLVLYFKAGLEAGEYCMWICAPPLEAEEAWAALAAAVPDLAEYRRQGRIEILPHDQWYLQDGRFDQERVLNGWLTKLKEAQARGCVGLRLSGNTFWLEKKDWKTFAEYEEAIDAVLHNHPIIALCTYSLERCGAAEIADVLKNHEFALLKRGGKWDLIESHDRRRMLEAYAREIAFERERVAVTLESIGEAVISTDTAGRVVLLNKAAAQLTGWSQAEAAGRPLSEIFRLFDERTGAPAEDPVQKVLAARQVVGVSHRANLRRRDGTLCPIADRAAPILGRDGDIQGVVLVFRDVTEERRLEEERRKNLARFELLAGTAGDLLQARDPKKAIESLCARVMEHLGCQVFVNYLVAEPEQLRLHVQVGIPGEQAAEAQSVSFGSAISGRVAQQGKRIVAEHIQENPEAMADAQVRAHGLRAYACHPMMGHGGQVIGTLGFGTTRRDTFEPEELALMEAVTDQVAMALLRLHDEEALRASEEALRNADRRKNEFLAELSHELRNPLAPISNGLFILERAAPGGEQARWAQAIIRRQFQQLSRLVDDLLDVTRITRNKITLQKEVLDVNELVRRVAEDQRFLFEEKECQLFLELAPEPVYAAADPTRLAQVVGNLLQNSVKFMTLGGTARVSVAAAGERVQIAVKDDGVGIPPETLSSLFEPFMQIEPSRDRAKGGLGLGLALVKGLVELHGGTVHAHSAGTGQGAEFVVRLPRASPVRAAARQGEGLSEKRARRVLIIEDHVDTAQTLCDALATAGHQVAVAHSGAEGLEVARAFEPEVVLCDLGLPVMDGFEVARAFRSGGVARPAMLVALTGYAQPEDRARAIEAGFDRHMAKPPNLTELVELLNGPPDPTAVKASRGKS